MKISLVLEILLITALIAFASAKSIDRPTDSMRDSTTVELNVSSVENFVRKNVVSQDIQDVQDSTDSSDTSLPIIPDSDKFDDPDSKPRKSDNDDEADDNIFNIFNLFNMHPEQLRGILAGLFMNILGFGKTE